MDVTMLAIGTIDAGALARDRSGLDAEALRELKLSIARGGVRMPVEVFALEEARGEVAWGLISGYRRLWALRELHEATGQARYACVPALVRTRVGEAEALAAMVAENALRAGLSAWERGRIAVAARDAGAYPTVAAAVEGLYGSAGQAKRGRMRALARLAEEMDGALPAPEAMSERLALRLAQAVQAGNGAMIRAALGGVPAAGQGAALEAVLGAIAGAEEVVGGAGLARVRRVAARRREVSRLTGRWERLAAGWAFTVTGEDATEALAAAVMARIRRLFEPA